MHVTSISREPSISCLEGLGLPGGQFSDENLGKSYSTLAERKASYSKIIPSLEDAVRLSGLRDGI